MSRLEKWKEVWERKGSEAKRENLTLGDLIAMDGFDKGAGKMTEETWMKAVERVKRELDQNIEGYGESSFRFNVLLWRRK